MTKWNANKRKRPENLPGAATASTPKPGGYPLWSLESRAAARALIQDRHKGGTVIQIAYVSPDGTRSNGPRYEIPPE